MNRFRFGTGQYVTTNANVNAVVARLRELGQPDSANFLRNAQPDARRYHLAAAEARRLALREQTPNERHRNIASVGNINRYFKRIGMTNANKIKAFIAIYNPVYFPANYPYRNAASRRAVLGNYEPTFRNYNWFRTANQTNWARRAGAAHGAVATIKRGIRGHIRRRNAKRSVAASHVLRSILVPSSARRSASPGRRARESSRANGAGSSTMPSSATPRGHRQNAAVNRLPNNVIREIMRSAFPGQRIARNNPSPRRNR